MIRIRFSPMPTPVIKTFWRTDRDDYRSTKNHMVSNGQSVACRHSLRDEELDASNLILAYCPLPETQAFAETGPIFLHTKPCGRFLDKGQRRCLPSVRLFSFVARIKTIAFSMVGELKLGPQKFRRRWLGD